jgi:hypothetical protein
VNRALVFALSITAVAGLSFEPAAARLHYPLAPDSTARNGEREHLESHPSSLGPASPIPLTRVHANAAAGLKRSYSGTPIDVLTYHYDNYPTGWNQSETDLTPATVHSASFGVLTTINVDGDVMAQPLLVSNFRMPDNSVHDVLVVATEHNSIYAFDAKTYTQLWRVSLGKSQSSTDVACSDVQPEYGISSTPVIVRTADNAAAIYVVAATEPASMSFHTKFQGLDLGTGAKIANGVEIAPKANLPNGNVLHFDPQNQWSRSALVYANNSIYVGISSHCDHNPGSISGWMLRYDPHTLKILDKFHTIEVKADYELASIWMSGYGPAVDPTGNIFAVTGNGNFSQTAGAKSFGQSVISLKPELRLKGYFTPAAYQQMNDNDWDLGSGGVMLLPVVSGQQAPPMAVTQGKNKVLYLLNANKLGALEGQGRGPLATYTLLQRCWCGPAYYGDPNGALVYYQGSQDILHAYRVSTAKKPSLTDAFDGTTTAGGGGSFPVVTSNGTTPSTAVVWLIRRGMPEQLEAYDAATLGAPIYSGTAGTWSNGYNAFITPLVANGRAYVGAYKTVTVFGLTN